VVQVKFFKISPSTSYNPSAVSRLESCRHDLQTKLEASKRKSTDRVDYSLAETPAPSFVLCLLPLCPLKILTWLILANSTPSSVNIRPTLKVRPSAARSVFCSSSSQSSSSLTGGGVKNRREKSRDDTTLADVRGRFERDRGRNDNVESRMNLHIQR
jgi:hypothetical protein